MKTVPHIADGTSVTAVERPDGLHYRVTPAHRGAGTLVPARTLTVLLLMDGERTLEEVHTELMALGFKMKDPSGLLQLAGVFEAAGVVDLHHAYVTVNELRHRCECCGRSCEGHLVGPIDEDEAQELQERLDLLNRQRGEAGTVAATVMVRFEGEEQRVLSFPGGVCVFLDGDKKCRLHARWGSTAKPLPCRMFPYRFVRTETGTRVVASPRCFHAYQHYRGGPETTPAALLQSWDVWRPPALIQGLDPRKASTLTLNARAQKNLDHESALLAEIAGAEDLASVLGRLATPPLEPSTAPSLESRNAYARQALSILRRLLVERFSSDGEQKTSRFGNDAHALREAIVLLDATELSDWNDIPKPAWEYVRHALESFVFAREVLIYGSVRAGVVAFSLGVLAARWLCPREHLEKGALEAFAGFLTVWIRITSSPEVQEIIFPEPGICDQMLSLLKA